MPYLDIQMALSFEIENLPGFVYVRFAGNLEPSMMHEVLVKVASNCASLGVSKVVMDFREVTAMEAGTVPFFWRYEMALVICRHFSQLSRLMVLQLPSQMEVDKLMENMLANRGIVAIVTSQIDSGMRWLLGDEIRVGSGHALAVQR